MIYRNPVQRLVYASKYSLQGLAYALRNEQAFRYEAAVLAMICILLCVMPFTLWQRILLAVMWLAVMALELVNSAVEKAFDLISEGYRPEIKAGKDMISASHEYSVLECCDYQYIYLSSGRMILPFMSLDTGLEAVPSHNVP